MTPTYPQTYWNTNVPSAYNYGANSEYFHNLWSWLLGQDYMLKNPTNIIYQNRGGNQDFDCMKTEQTMNLTIGNKTYFSGSIEGKKSSNWQIKCSVSEQLI
jgi:hypothetical protein